MSLPTMKLTVSKLYDLTGIQVQQLADAALLTTIAYKASGKRRYTPRIQTYCIPLYVRPSPRAGRLDL
ncbi:COP9 signalosome complex subunit 1 [Fusarium oxysporum f. sp. albedinis]|nr:COP9 signalosome complex subunit 1 [Fusarium oxysporum f. sp. albedinis]